MEEERDFFISKAWCTRLLNDPDFISIATPSRSYNASTTEDALIARTLKTQDTIQAVTTFYRKPAPGAARVEELRQLLSLEFGVNGYPHMAHGGLIGIILDEAMGTLILVNRKLRLNIGNSSNSQPIKQVVTAYLKITYLKPVTTPQVILATATFREIVGTKIYIDGVVSDANGTVLATAESLWLGLKKPQEKL